MDDVRGKGFMEFAKEVAISLGLDVAVLGFVKHFFEHRKNEFQRKVVDIGKVRREVFLDIKILTDRGRQPMRLIQWLNDMAGKHRENDAVAILGNCPVGNEGRRPSFEFLNGLPDDQFKILTYLLNPDVENQWLARRWENAEAFAKLVKTKVTADQLDAIAGKAIPTATKFATWAQNLPGTRKRRHRRSRKAREEEQGSNTAKLRRQCELTAEGLWDAGNFQSARVLRMLGVIACAFAVWAIAIFLVAMSLPPSGNRSAIIIVLTAAAVAAVVVSIASTLSRVSRKQPLLVAGGIAVAVTSPRVRGAIARPLKLVVGLLGILLAVGVFFAALPMSKDVLLSCLIIAATISYALLRFARWAKLLRGALIVIVIGGVIYLVNESPRTSTADAEVVKLSVSSADLSRPASLTSSPHSTVIPAAPTQPQPCSSDTAQQVEDFNQAYLSHPPAPGQAFKAVVTNYADPCFGPDVVRLPDAFNSGWCLTPYPDPNGGDPSWSIAFEMVQQDQRGDWAPVQTSKTIHWTSRPEDRLRLDHLPLTFRLRGHHAPGGGIMFWKGPAASCGASPPA
jgi:hypothetical protein